MKILPSLFLFLPLPAIVLPPGGAEQSEASERPGGGQVSTPKEARPVSVPHQPGEGDLHLKVATELMTLLPAHSETFFKNCVV